METDPIAEPGAASAGGNRAVDGALDSAVDGTVTNPGSTNGFVLAPAVVGGGLVVLGLSGLVDDSGLLSHPWWIAMLIFVAAPCLLIIRRTLARMRSVGPG